MKHDYATCREINCPECSWEQTRHIRKILDERNETFGAGFYLAIIIATTALFILTAVTHYQLSNFIN